MLIIQLIQEEYQFLVCLPPEASDAVWAQAMELADPVVVYHYNKGARIDISPSSRGKLLLCLQQILRAAS